jgi:hypothetical protein
MEPLRKKMPLPVVTGDKITLYIYLAASCPILIFAVAKNTNV